MRVVGLYKHLPIEDPQSLVDLHIEKPALPIGHDLLIAVKAVSVNPVDTKVRKGLIPVENENLPHILGWDASGKVIAVGPDCTLFREGDEVYYAGTITRPGTNSQFHVVDERIVGRKPKTLSFEEASAMPLTTITAWEALFDRLSLSEHISKKTMASMISNDSIINIPEKKHYILIIGGAGGVGSIAIQLAKQVAAASHSLAVIATASRNESRAWCNKMGADYVINHHDDIKKQLQQIVGIDYVDYILCLNDTDSYFSMMAHSVAPQGRICSIVETNAPVNLGGLLRQKSVAFVWELMFTRSLYQTQDMIKQHHLLNLVADLIDDKRIRTTLTEVLSPINSENLRKAHKKLESGRTIGKIVLSGFF